MTRSSARRWTPWSTPSLTPIALITFDQIKTIAPLLLAKGVKPDQMFLVDGNTSDLSKELGPGHHGKGPRAPSPAPSPRTNSKRNWRSVDDKLNDYAYAGESYDAVNLVALASEAAGSTKGKDIAKQMQAVSEDGEKCYDFAGCVTLLRNGKDIDYDGISGPISFDKNGDPTEAYIGIYQYDDNNVPKPVKLRSSASSKRSRHSHRRRGSPPPAGASSAEVRASGSEVSGALAPGLVQAQPGAGRRGRNDGGAPAGRRQRQRRPAQGRREQRRRRPPREGQAPPSSYPVGDA